MRMKKKRGRGRPSKLMTSGYQRVHPITTARYRGRRWSAREHGETLSCYHCALPPSALPFDHRRRITKSKSPPETSITRKKEKSFDVRSRGAPQTHTLRVTPLRPGRAQAHATHAHSLSGRVEALTASLQSARLPDITPRRESANNDPQITKPKVGRVDRGWGGGRVGAPHTYPGGTSRRSVCRAVARWANEVQTQRQSVALCSRGARRSVSYRWEDKINLEFIRSFGIF